jgi:hypothetical protein
VKIVIAKASVTAVTPIMEKHGKGKEAELVPGVAVTLAGQVPPELLNEFNARLLPALFEKDIPTLPEVGEIAWIPQYENAAFTIHGLKFSSADVKKIIFAALPGYLLDFKCTVKVTNPGDELSGKLNGLLRHEVKVRLEKMTQKVLDPDEGEEEDPQGELIEGKLTKDGQPLKPLMPAIDLH